MHADTEGVATELLAGPWLRRSVTPAEFSTDTTVFLNNLQVKICLNTYKLFYLVNTEDTLVRYKTNRVVEPKKLAYNRAARIYDGKKWTQNGHVTKEAQNAAAAAAEKEQQMVVVPTASATPGIQISPPPASSVTPAPQSEAPRSVEPTPNPPASLTEKPSISGDVKVESPPAPAETGEAMDVESSTPVIAESRVEEVKPANEDVEMLDA
jgi:paired amphipathic helix protein Sin3a